MTRFVTALVALLALSLGAKALSPVSSEITLPQQLHFKTCTVKTAAGDPWQLTTQGGRVRFAQYGHRYPDNTLRVRQSYDLHGKLAGISVTVTGFAGPLLNVRAAVNARGKLLREQGFRRAGFTAPLLSYLRQAPKACPATPR